MRANSKTANDVGQSQKTVKHRECEKIYNCDTDSSFLRSAKIDNI